MGGSLGLPNITDPMVKIHVEAGRLRRLYADCKHMTTAEPGQQTALAVAPPRLDFEGAPPPILSLESMTSMKKGGVVYQIYTPHTHTCFRPTVLVSKYFDD